MAGRRFVFDAFRMDLASHRLWREQREIPLRRKSWDVLCYLVAHPDVLITKEALHRAIWPDVAVSDDTLTKSIGELRRALGDDAHTPRCIETVHGRGFRFVAGVREASDGAEEPAETLGEPPLAPAAGGANIPFVGRQPELQRLQEALLRADRGERQVVFIMGEAGVGKTALVDEFLKSSAVRRSDVHILQGQCIQQRGQREPYMPVLQALERLLRSGRGDALVALLRRIAPCWFLQIPWLSSAAEPNDLRDLTSSATPERMLREGAAFLESLAGAATVVLIIEDLHWSDIATTDLLALLGQRSNAARLLVIGTYRPAEASTVDHPIRDVMQTVRWRHRRAGLSLDYLSRANVHEYLRRRLDLDRPDLARLIHTRTDGNALFMVAVVDELIRRGELILGSQGWALSVPADRLELTVPEDVSEMIASQFRGLDDREQSVLEVASVVGVRFALETVARALGWETEDVEVITQHLATTHYFVRAVPVLVGIEYVFVHALHQHVIYRLIPEARRQRWHRTIAETREAEAGDLPAQVAPELSVHFEQSGEYVPAVKYLAVCVARAQQRFAHRAAIAYAEHALRLLTGLPNTRLRLTQELELRVLLSVSLGVTRGYASPEGKENYARAQALCGMVGDTRKLFEIVHARWYAELVSGELDDARRSADELKSLADPLDSDELRWRARLAWGRTRLWDGQFGPAVDALTRCVADLDRQPVRLRAETYGAHPAVAALIACGLALWFFGCPDQARAQSSRAVAEAEKEGRTFDVAAALFQCARVELLCGEVESAVALAKRAEIICREQDVAFFLPGSRFILGAVRAERGETDRGLAVMLRELAESRAVSGPFLSDFMLASIAMAYGRAAKWDEGLRRVDEGLDLAATRGESLFVAELWRIKGELLLGQARSAKGKKSASLKSITETANDCLRRSLQIAQKQEARSLALRTAMSLVRVSTKPEASLGARELLRSLYASFIEGFNTRDLQEAKAVLASVAVQ